MARTHLLVCAVLALALVPLAYAQGSVCPAGSTETTPNLCFCQDTAVCVSPQGDFCRETVTGTDFFPKNCTACSCVLAPTIHNVVVPSYGANWIQNTSYDIVWTSSGAIARVDIDLFEETVTLSGTKRLRRVLNIATNTTNTGVFRWRVPTSVDPKSVYTIVVAANGADLALVFNNSPLFTISAVPTGTCPPGFTSSNGLYPNCQACPKGFYANAGQTNCIVCKDPFTTLSVGSASEAACSVDKASYLANFNRFSGFLLVRQAIRTINSTTVHNCAMRCMFDKTCKSFDYTPDISVAGTGSCELSSDNRATSLVHYFQPSNSTTDYYELINSTASLNGFDRFELSYIDDVTAVEIKEASLEACAAVCVKDLACKSFTSGVGARAGVCFLSRLNRATAGNRFITGTITAQHTQLDYYERKGLSVCAPGSVSATSMVPCTLCDRNSFSNGTSPTVCQACPANTFIDFLGGVNRTQCAPLTCPSNSRGPDVDGDCVCTTGATCTGPSCLCDGTAAECSTANGGVRYFSVTCKTCQCSVGVQPPSIDFIFTPKTNDNLYYLRTYPITYQASTGVAFVTIALYRMVTGNPSLLTPVRTLALSTPNTGFFNWTVASDIPALTAQYAIVIFHAPRAGETAAPTHRNTGYFSIGPAPTGICPSGMINPATGRHPCTLCPIGTYWTNATTCTRCPANRTTEDPGSRSVSDCTITAAQALFSFQKNPNMYFRGSNAAGVFIEDVDHKTPEECARLCLDDAGCKSFDSGVIGQFQQGDCFLSYDNRATIRSTDVLSISQLNLYEKINAVPVLDRLFTRKEGCYINENDEGGIYLGMYSPESCAQMCINDVCCKSFDAGKIGSAKEYDCFLSYSDENDARETGDFVCNSKLYDFYEKKVVVQFVFPRTNFSTLLPTAQLQNSFAVEVKKAILALQTIDDNLQVFVTVSRDPNSLIQVALTLTDTASRTNIQTAVRTNSLSVIFPPTIGNEYFAAFSPNAGPCDIGTVSQTGDRTVNGCQTCRANTYSNRAQTLCRQCPSGTTSIPGSFGVNSCQLPAAADSRNPFRFGDEWVGTYTATCASATGGRVPCGGTLEMSIVSVVGNNVRILCTFYHGGFCDVSKGCRIESPGISAFYSEGVVSGNSLNALYVRVDGWTGITDRSFVREDINGSISIKAGQLTYSGMYGANGTFAVRQRCKASDQIGSFTTGDKWVGSYQCDRINVDGTKSKEGEKDYRRMELFIQAQDDRTITALVDFDYQGGVGQYMTRGFYQEASVCRSVELTPLQKAWVTPVPPFVHAHQLAGRISDDGEYFLGQLNINPVCTCTGITPPGDPLRGATCGNWSSTDRFRWCYMSANCPSAVPSEFPGFFRGPCVFPVCNDFKLARVCETDKVICDPGWTGHRGRCYRFFPTAANFNTSETACQALGGNLASVRDQTDNDFVRNITRINNATVDTWIGLMAGAVRPGQYDWIDGAPSDNFINWGVGRPSQNNGCAFIAKENGAWVDSNCTIARPYVCKKGSLGVNASCACTGTVDDKGFGGYCAKFGQNRTWCYTNEFCPRALPMNTTRAGVKLFKTHCLTEEAAEQMTTVEPEETTESPSCHEADPTQYTRDDGNCATCVTAANCTRSQVLIGVCGELTTPTCIDCHPSCLTCDGLGSLRCLTCAVGYVRASDNVSCIASCPGGQYNDNGRCALCDSTCSTCSGAGPKACTSCMFGSDRFFDGTSCTSTCNVGQPFYKEKNNQLCLRCTSCTSDQFQTTPCTEFANSVCTNLTVCGANQFESTAPTATSNRFCTDITVCPTGSEEFKAPTKTSDRVCNPCKAGFYHNREDVGVPCRKCDPGTYTPQGWIGTCPLCTPGTADSDSNPGTPCQACADGTFADDAGKTSCAPWTNCVAGQHQAAAPSDRSNRICLPCVNGTFTTGVNELFCVSWTTCGAGEEPDFSKPPSTTQDRVCKPCGANFFKAQEGNFPCQAVTVCPAGSEEAIAPTATSDRVCRPCELGSNFNPKAGGICSPIAVCSSTQFRAVRPTTTANTICQALTDCGDSAYEAIPAGSDTDRVCRNLTVCGKDEWAVVPPVRDPVSKQFTRDRVCSKCSTCPDGKVPDAACTPTSDTVCRGCKSCNFGVEYITKPCLSGVDTVCAKCDVCTSSQFTSEPCSANANTVCKDLKTCSDSEYEQVAPTKFSDRVCAKVTVCRSDQVEVIAPTRTSDRVCSGCVLGQTFASGNLCLNVTVCGAGQEEKSKPTLTSDRVCGPCAQGTFKPAPGSETCKPITPCAPGLVEDVPATASSDRSCRMCDPDAGEYQNLAGQTQCKQVSNCLAGEFIVANATSQSDRVCKSCPKETFTASMNQPQCQPWSLCSIGQGQSVAPTASTDRVCATCQKGVNFSPKDDAIPCTTVSVCDRGFEEKIAPTISTDRVCGSCVEGSTYSDTVGNGPCTPVSDCPPGQEEALPPTIRADRTCKPCADGFFKDVIGKGPCKKYRDPCPAGTYESKAPSAFGDRVCTPCNPASGEFQDQVGQSACKRLSNCKPGTYLAADGRADADRQCTSCPEGKYSDTENVIECIPCAPGEFQDLRGQVKCRKASACSIGYAQVTVSTPTEDTKCRLCDGRDSKAIPIEYQDQPGQVTCKTASTCSADKTVRQYATPISDTVCSCILGETYQLGSVFDPTQECLPVTRCRTSEIEFLPPTLSTDRYCVLANTDGQVQLIFEGDFDVLLNTRAKQDSFSRTLERAVLAIKGMPRNLRVRASVEKGSILAGVRVSDKNVIPLILDAAENGNLKFDWPDTNGQTFQASNYGKCSPGSASPSGSYPDCKVCAAGTYSNADNTACVQCPPRQTSKTGSAGRESCFQASSSTSSSKSSNAGIIGGIIAAACIIAGAILVYAVIRRRSAKAHFDTPSALGLHTPATEFSNPLYDTTLNAPARSADNPYYSHPMSEGGSSHYVNPSSLVDSAYSEPDGQQTSNYFDVAPKREGSEYFDVAPIRKEEGTYANPVKNDDAAYMFVRGIDEEDHV